MSRSLPGETVIPALARGRAVAAQRKLVRGAAILFVLATGCLYVDPINEPPSADIVQDPVATVFRGGTVGLRAITSDPDRQRVTVAWRIYACTDASAPAGCDRAPFRTAVDDVITVDVPKLRADVEQTPVQSLRVILEATDSLGATARPDQELLIPVSDMGPSLELRKDGRYGFVVGTPVDLYAKVGDPDDDPATGVFLGWHVFSPAGAAPVGFSDLTVPPDPMDPAHVQAGKELVATTAGDYDVQVTASDLAGLSAQQDVPVTIVPDHPPCLSSWAPLAAPAGQTLPLTEATLFQVLVVADDLDPYPTVPGDPVLGTTSFAWSLLPPGGGTREPLGGVTGNSVALDPAAYSPGDIVELRVEIQDRQHHATCNDDNPTCSIIGDPSCTQRLTWRVEVQ